MSRPVSLHPITLTLPSPPSANRYWRHVGARVLLSADARAYRETVATLALVARVHPLPEGVQCAVTLRWYRERRSGDLDNRIKQVLDALRGVAYQDDSQVVELHAYREDDARFPRLHLVITPLPSDPASP